jgi:alpha-galactosidase
MTGAARHQAHEYRPATRRAHVASRIAIIGAGSAMFSLSLIRDLCLTPSLAGSTVVFVDVDAQRLAAAHELCRRYAAELGTTLLLEQTTDRRAALRGAEFVVNTALVAGHQALRDGWAVALRHGYRMGGSLHVVHDEAFWINFFQFELCDAVAADMLELCPDAWLLQVANPVLAGVTWLGRRFPALKVVGLCHGFMGVYNLADQLGLSRDGLRFEIPGVNHFVWLNALEHEGRDALPLVDRWIAERAPDYWQRCRPSDGLGPAPVDLYRRLGRFPIGDTATPGGGSWPPWYHVDDATERAWHEDPMAWWDEVYFGEAGQAVGKLRRVAEDPAARVTDLVPPGKSGEVMVEVIESIASDLPRVLVGNVLNTGGFVPGVPADFAVEVPIRVSAAGVEGLRTRELPRAVLARLWRDRLAPVEVELAAYAQRSRELLRQLILMDPFSHSLDQAAALLDDILAMAGHEAMAAYYR